MDGDDIALAKLSPNALPNALGLTRRRNHMPAQRAFMRVARARWIGERYVESSVFADTRFCDWQASDGG